MFILFSLKHFFNIFDSLDSEKKKLKKKKFFKKRLSFNVQHLQKNSVLYFFSKF